MWTNLLWSLSWGTHVAFRSDISSFKSLDKVLHCWALKSTVRSRHCWTAHICHCSSSPVQYLPPYAGLKLKRQKLKFKKSLCSLLTLDYYIFLIETEHQFHMIWNTIPKCPNRPNHHLGNWKPLDLFLSLCSRFVGNIH